MKNPKISIVISCYNQARYLPNAIDSFINQTYKNIELILIDDGSPDNTRKVIESYARQELPIEIKGIFQSNKDLFPSFDNGFRNYATGEYIGWCEADSMYEDFIIQDFVNEINEHDADYVYCNLQQADGNFNVISKREFPQTPDHYLRWTVCSIFKKSLYLELDGFNNQFQSQDIEFYFRMYLKGIKVRHVNKFGWRTIDHNHTNRLTDRWNTENKRRVDEDITIINALMNYLKGTHGNEIIKYVDNAQGLHDFIVEDFYIDARFTDYKLNRNEIFSMMIKD